MDAPPEDQEWFTVEELAAWLRLDKPQIYRMNRARSGPPRYKVGIEIRYRRCEVEEWLEGQKVTA